MMAGRDATDADIERFISAYNTLAMSPPSEEMQSFSKIYNDGGRTFASWFEGVKANPTILPAMFVSSTSAMFNKGSLVAAIPAAGAGFLAGGPMGALGVGMGTASGTLDAALTFGELLSEEIGGPLTTENVREVLNDDEAYTRIENAAKKRGFTIGVIDALTGIAGAGATARAVKATAKTGAISSKVIGAGAGGAVEVGGGLASEVAGRAAAGQEQDVAEVMFEGVTGLTTAPIDISFGIYQASKGGYKINNGKASREDVIKFLETSTDSEFAAVPLEIVNDEELLALATERKNKIKKLKSAQENVVSAGVTDPEKVAKLSELEVEKQGLEGNTTEAGKRRLKEVKDQINNILDEPTEVVSAEEGVRIYEGKDKDGKTKQVKLTTQKKWAYSIRCS